MYLRKGGDKEMDDLQTIWTKTLEKTYEMIAEDIAPDQFTSTFYPSELVELENGKAIIVSKLDFNRVVLNNYITQLTQALSEVTGEAVYIIIENKEKYEKSKKGNVVEEIEPLNDNLIAEYTFQEYVPGENNRLAYSAAMAILNNVGVKTYNPLFIYGNAGLGKTHLMCAIGNEVKRRYPSKRILFISASDFVKEYIQSIEDNSTQKYFKKFESLDMLLVDDVQFIGNKVKSMEEFFHIFNKLMNKNAQIIITSDKSPDELVDIEARLVSRFSSGLSASIDKPNYETRIAILNKKLQSLGIAYAFSDDLADYIAQESQDIRSLEGKIKSVMISYLSQDQNIEDESLSNGIITLDYALKYVFDAKKTQKSTSIEVDDKAIIKTVAKYYNLPYKSLIQKGRTQNVALARQIAMYLIKTELDYSYVQIGKIFGGRDHATVMRACEKVKKCLETDPNYRIAIEDIKKLL